MLMQLVSALTAVVIGADSTPRDTLPATIPAAAVALRQQDTVRRRPRPRAVEVSEWYGRRLTIHRTLSYATLPVFAAQWVAGERLFKYGSAAPEWAKTTHRVGATTLAGIFTVNTVTGLWNLWDSRSTPDHRALRTTHALLMLAADGAFTYTGLKLSQDAERSADKRSLHRTVALSAMGVTVASGIMMKLFNK
jgi:hypothetical protein